MARIQKSIQAFGRASKPNTDVNASISRKRKQSDEEVSSSPAPAIKSNKKVRLQLETPPETPTKVLKRALTDLSLSTPAQPNLKGGKRKRVATPELETETPPTTPEYDGDDEILPSSELPDELHQLTRLNSAMLTALSLHYAHHGTSSPIDVCTLTPSITKIWGKRKVTLDDIRLCLGVTNMKISGERVSTPAFSLALYANGKVCLELNASKKRQGALSQSFDEKSLNARFATRLGRAWSRFDGKSETTSFISSLPLIDVPKSATYKKVAPMLAKGQQRLEEVMKPKAANEQSPTPQSRQKRRKPSGMESSKNEQKQVVASPSSSKENTPGIEAAEAGFRSLGLIERIRHKEIYKSTLPTPPTKVELERIAALQRAEELLDIVDLLAAGKGGGLRVSFPLPALVKSVQSSIRSPLSREEIENCLEVLAKDIAGGYINMMAVGSTKCVIINKAFKPWPEEVREKLVECGVVF
ncbi:hypothetical protein EJ08DRAFT_645397 [Tothia fuscella]|uniref:DNA replication factor Cdt1 C-terminal domain-containing protein n=1 Tax=Tothia fuscella TaxID=1048955 RepID=A0A9P4U3K6_9PEZI|nr:hypothetical protein EJ08DRAFT_645397 [Tothia fuscella]